MINNKMKPDKFNIESTTIWSFPDRGSWATHTGDYRGNWSPYIPRNLIELYSKPGDWVLDQFIGGGTTLIEAKLLNRNVIGVDINKEALKKSKERISFESANESRIFLKNGDAADLYFIPDCKIDLICTHPPYADIIKYSKDIPDDISLLPVDKFLEKMDNVAKECYRVLKKGKICSVMIGDIRRRGYVLPLGFELMQIYLKNQFVLKEIIIKQQHNCRSTSYWNNRNRNFLLLAHEYIFVFHKMDSSG